ncbi:MAG TPA: cysteine hydrolase family protein [Pseudolabrys sp.]|nr:cysteine hydrolase family protein [Pseudolabrys sp.]
MTENWLPHKTPLLIVDVQLAIDDPKWGPRNNPDAERKIAALLAAWRQAALPVIHIRHDSTEPQSTYRENSPGHPFKPEAAPIDGELVIGKSVNSAFIGTELEAILRKMDCGTIAVCGVLTHNSVEATVRHGGNLGFRVLLAADACWSVDVTDLTGRHWPAEDVHQLSLAVMNGEYAEVTSAAALIAAARP